MSFGNGIANYVSSLDKVTRNNIHRHYYRTNMYNASTMRSFKRPMIKELSLSRNWLELTSMMRIKCSQLETIKFILNSVNFSLGNWFC